MPILVCKNFGRPSLCLSILPPMSFLKCAIEDWYMPTKSTTARGNTASKLHQSLVLLFLKQWRHMATNNSTNYTSRTMEPRPHNAQKILRRSKLRNAHRDVNVGRVATNKSKYCNPNHFNISYFRNPKPFSLVGFTFMQLIS